MIPEKWESIYLYASVIDQNKDLQSGEMFFYYYPKGVLKKNPVNVYEIPNRFNTDEDAYVKLVKDLYNKIKELRNEIVSLGEPKWSNLTISIENSTFKVQYEYEDLTTSEINNYYRHLLWRCKYLNIPLSSYNKKDKAVLARYIEKQKGVKRTVNVHTQGIYKEHYKNIIDYEKEDTTRDIELKSENDKDKEEKIKSQILNLKN